ncbi:MAG TPA: hypothetical protein DCS43_00230 [Verrucomicrobia bacterium]|nr:hypothetical protein [Verrucomicrobiota bacterium]
MAKIEYSKTLCGELIARIRRGALHISYRLRRYESGDTLKLALTTAWPEVPAKATFRVEKFVGGGFAGQVYRCVLESIALSKGGAEAHGLTMGKVYAVKILVPPGRFAVMFRNLIYWIAFQAPFSAQVLPSACRSGLLWPKVLRLAAREVFGEADAVADTYASFYDENFGAYGEVREWVEGRVWRLESDLEPWKRRDWRTVDPLQTGSPEYVAKHQFMTRLVAMMHAMGAYELARQYEWSTFKSQPNVLKRSRSELQPSEGLCAVDFRAGLALVPFLPMSPGDIKLIWQGLRRGSLAQFDRCDFSKLHAYAKAHPAAFASHQGLLDALERYDIAYRRRMPDITHQGGRLLVDKALRAEVREGLVAGYQAAGLVDDTFAAVLRKGGFRFGLFYVLGALPLAGRFLRQVWGQRPYRAHIKALWTQMDYLRRSGQVSAAATAVDWHRAGRVGEVHARRIADHVGLYWLERLTVGNLPVFLHRWLCEPTTVVARLKASIGYIRRFLQDASFREAWLREQIESGLRDGMLNNAEAEVMLAQVKDPFIAKYLKSVGVHLAFLPVSEVVWVTVGGIMAAKVYAETGDTVAAGVQFAAVVAIFQLIPISPGSICRGLYVAYLMVRERNFKDYAVAAPLSFVKVIGYLAFPIQMATVYPELAQFMAGRWATDVVHIIPVFGEKGALLERYVFDRLFNRSRLAGQRIGRHICGLLTLLMVSGLLAGGYVLAQVDWHTAAGLKTRVNTMIGVVCLCVLPRVLFYPLLTKRNRGISN